MRIQPVVLRAASTVTILGTALAAALIAAPAQANGSGANAGHSARPHLRLPAAAGLVSGIVDGAGGRPLTGACVVATGPGGSTLAVTHSDGRYVLGGLRPGGYTLHYSACGAGGHYMDQWSGGASLPAGATTVTIARGQARELAPVTLRTPNSASSAPIPRAIAKLMAGAGLPGGLAALRSVAPTAMTARATSSSSHGAITGTVTGGGKPLRGICAFAYGNGYGQARTSKTGQYRISKLAPGRYFVFFIAGYCGKNSGNWLPQFYKNINGPNFRHPTRVRVTAGQTTTGIDAALQLGGEISGTVRSQRGTALSRVCVFVFGKVGRFFFRNFGMSGKHGHYAVHSLFPGKYQVAFVPNYCANNGNFVPQWWRDSATQKHATKVTITHGLIVRHVDAALPAGAIISGVVRAARPRGALLKGICVFAQPVRPQGFFPTYANGRTGADGSYRLTGLLAGKYRVFFTRGCGNNGNFLPVHRSVSLVLGHTTSGVNAFMPPGAIISGTVTNTQGNPVRGVCVQVSGRSFGEHTTNAEGRYSIIALQTGNYRVGFSGGCGNSGSYAPQFYRGQDNDGSANLVGATAGKTTSGIDATMQPGGTITGAVTDPAGHAQKRVCVSIEGLSVTRYGYPFNITETSKQGVFTVRNLVPGLYAVNFNCLEFFGPHRNKFASQWFMGQPGQGTANDVSAPAGVITSGINAVLRPGGFVTGTVTNSAGKPVSDMCVQVTPHGSAIAPPNFFNQGTLGFTNSHGIYRVGPVSAAKYDVQIGCFQSRYASQWFGGGAARASATPVTVTDGGTATGVNAVLTAGGSISGEVTTGANHPQPDVCVEATDAANNSSGFGYTNRHGRYSMSGLSSGTYEIGFFDCGFGRHHVRLGAGARLATVTAPQATTGVDETLFPAGSISGVVLGGPGATPQDNACVVAVPVSMNASYDYTTTDVHGAYRLGDLAPGTYNVYFGDPFCAFAGAGYAPQWYNNQSSQAAAAKVTVTSGGDKSSIDATLGADGVISGTVTSHHHTPVAGECVTATPVHPVADPLVDAVLPPVIGVTAGDGTYALVGLLPGKYTVMFSVGCGDTGFRTQWWQHAGTASEATVITVPASTTVSGIDAELHHHGNGD